MPPTCIVLNGHTHTQCVCHTQSCSLIKICKHKLHNTLQNKIMTLVIHNVYSTLFIQSMAFILLYYLYYKMFEVTHHLFTNTDYLTSEDLIYLLLLVINQQDTHSITITNHYIITFVFKNWNLP